MKYCYCHFTKEKSEAKGKPCSKWFASTIHKVDAQKYTQRYWYMRTNIFLREWRLEQPKMSGLWVKGWRWNETDWRQVWGLPLLVLAAWLRLICPLARDAVLFLCPLYDYLLLTTVWTFRASGMDEKLEFYFVFKKMLQSKSVLFKYSFIKWS